MEKPSGLNNGCEQHEYFYDARGKRRCQYDYRHYDGTLYSCVKNDLTSCIAAKNAWLEDHLKKS